MMDNTVCEEQRDLGAAALRQAFHVLYPVDVVVCNRGWRAKLQARADLHRIRGRNSLRHNHLPATIREQICYAIPAMHAPLASGALPRVRSCAAPWWACWPCALRERQGSGRIAHAHHASHCRMRADAVGMRSRQQTPCTPGIREAEEEDAMLVALCARAMISCREFLLTGKNSKGCVSVGISANLRADCRNMSSP